MHSVTELGKAGVQKYVILQLAATAPVHNEIFCRVPV